MYVKERERGREKRGGGVYIDVSFSLFSLHPSALSKKKTKRGEREKEKKRPYPVPYVKTHRSNLIQSNPIQSNPGCVPVDHAKPTPIAPK